MRSLIALWVTRLPEVFNFAKLPYTTFSATCWLRQGFADDGQTKSPAWRDAMCEAGDLEMVLRSGRVTSPGKDLASPL